jgi:hypothetical protein
VDQVAFQDDFHRRIVGIARQHVVLPAVAIGRVVEPIVPARRVVGIESLIFVSPCDALSDDVPNAGLAAAHLEAGAVSVRRAGRAFIGISIAVGPAILHDDRNLLIDEIPPVVRIPPGATALEYGARSGCLVVNAEAVRILAVALRRVRVVVVVRIAVDDFESASASVSVSPSAPVSPARAPASLALSLSFAPARRSRNQKGQ